MKNLITILGFEKELREAIKEIIADPLKLADFMCIQVESQPETKPIMNFSWKNLGHTKPIFNEKVFDKMISVDKENTIKLFSKALSNDLLSDEAILRLFNHSENKNNFYRKIISFRTLLKCDKLNIPIWKTININNNEEILLPLYVWNSEAIKIDTKTILDVEGKVKFFDKNISKWFALTTEKTSNKELISRIAYRIATDQKNKNYIKSLGLNLNVEHDYIFNNGKRCNIKDLLLSKGLIKLIPASDKTRSLDLVKLVCSKIPKTNQDQITTQKRFSKLWFKYLKETDFSYIDRTGNLANHTFQKVPNCYLPLIDIHNEKEPKFEHEFTSNKTQLALYKWLNLLHEKQVDFTNKDLNERSAMTNLLIHLSLNDYTDFNKFLNDDELVIKIWNTLEHTQKKDIFSQYVSQWSKIEKLITPELSHSQNSYQDRHVISDVINLFCSADLLDNKETNTQLLSFFSKYDKVKGISDTIKKINHQQLKLSFPEKDIIEVRKVKI